MLDPLYTKRACNPCGFFRLSLSWDLPRYYWRERVRRSFGNVFFVQLHLFLRRKKKEKKEKRKNKNKNKQNSFTNVPWRNHGWQCVMIYRSVVRPSTLGLGPLFFPSSFSYWCADIFPDDEGKVDSSWNSLFTLLERRAFVTNPLPACFFSLHLDSIQRS